MWHCRETGESPETFRCAGVSVCVITGGSSRVLEGTVKMYSMERRVTHAVSVFYSM